MDKIEEKINKKDKNKKIAIKKGRNWIQKTNERISLYFGRPM